MTSALTDYVTNLNKIFKELIALPDEEFNERMKQISNPSIAEFLTNPVSFTLGDEPIEYCNPTPRSYVKALELLEQEEP